MDRKYWPKNFADHMVTSLRTLVYKSNDIKSRVLNYLPMCARLKVFKRIILVFIKIPSGWQAKHMLLIET